VLLQNKVFAVLDNTTVAVRESVLVPQNHHRRMVDEWTRKPNGSYYRTTEAVDFEDYLTSNGFNIIPIPKTKNDALSHLLNLGDNRYLCTSKELTASLKASELFKGKITLIPMHTGMQSMTMVLERQPLEHARRVCVTHAHTF
jgi:hypothetical protein